MDQFLALLMKMMIEIICEFEIHFTLTQGRRPRKELTNLGIWVKLEGVL